MWKIILIAVFLMGCSKAVNNQSYEMTVARDCPQCTFGMVIVLITGDTIKDIGSITIDRDDYGTPTMFITKKGYLIPMTSVLWAKYGD